MMATVRHLRLLDASARMMTVVSGKDFCSFAHELRRCVYTSKVHIANSLWQVLVCYERLGKFCAMLTVRKPGMVLAWKQQIALIVEEIVSQLMRRMSSCGDARRFCVRLAHLSDEARRQVREKRQLGREKVLLWDRTSPKVMMSCSPHRVLKHSGSVSACWSYRSELDVCRAVYRKLTNGEFSPSIMFGVYFN
jgi:hypothetical protein